MRIGIQLGTHGHSGRTEHAPPRWSNVAAQLREAEDAGFDLVVVEDALLDGGMGTRGYWEAATVAGAVAAASSTIGLAHSVLNPPLRHPALVARTAATLDEISGGRYTLGVGAGNTPADYAAFGFPADHRYSRAAEAIEIVHALLKEGRVEHRGRFYSCTGDLGPAGPTRGGPPIVIGARGPRMTRLAARLGDGWNAWSPEPQTLDAFRPLLEELERACDEVGRDPSTLARSLDVGVDPHALVGDPPTGITEFVIAGSADEIAGRLLELGALGVDEVRVMVFPDRPPERRPELVAAMADVVERVHRG